MSECVDEGSWACAVDCPNIRGLTARIDAAEQRERELVAEGRLVLAEWLAWVPAPGLSEAWLKNKIPLIAAEAAYVAGLEEVVNAVQKARVSDGTSGGRYHIEGDDWREIQVLLAALEVKP